MEFRILGPLEAVSDDGIALDLGTSKQQALVAVLLLHRNEVVSRGRLIDELWGERPPATADKAVQGYVWRLRKTLAGRAAIATRAGGYLLELPDEQLDAARFEQLVDRARQPQTGDTEDAARRFREALALWRGPALAGLVLEAHARAEAGRLDELRLAATMDLHDCELALGRHEPLVAELEQLVAEHPLRERLTEQLMLALYRSGRQAEALRVYRRTRETLVAELGIEPSAVLRRLETAILRQDAELAAPVAVRVPAPPAASSAGAPARETRKTVTILVSDIVGSTELGEEADPEAVRQVLSRWHEEMRAVIERHGGTVEKFAGDEVMAVFGVPVLHEDDALRAVRAAAEMRTRLGEVNDELVAIRGVRLEARIGVNTGEVVAGDPSTGQTFVTGAAVNLARRLEQAAGPDEILVGERTHRLVEDAVAVQLLAPIAAKGLKSPVTAFRLERVDTSARPRVRRLDAPMVGRERERRLLAGAFERACSERSAHLVTILGAAGVGKSRLAADFLDSLHEALVLRGRCLSYGEGITYWPVVEMLKQLGGLPDAELEPLARSALLHVLGEEGQPASTEEIAWAFRKLLEAHASTRPVAVLVDDLHWAEPTLLDLLEHVADLSREVPILLLCLARPELLEHRPGWAGGKLNATTVLLEPLAEEEAEALIERLLGGERVTLQRRQQIRSAAEGNPLFIEEMVALVREGEPEGKTVPSSIQALLAARLDQLPADERDVLARGSVEGKVFHREAVRALATEEADVAACLTRLIRKELLRPDRSVFAGDEAFRFRHQLIRDAAYDALPKATRADLHDRLAAWLEGRAAELAEADEIVGYHYEQAAGYRSELGRVDDRARDLAARAGRRLASAARRAVDRNDSAAAIPLLTRALALLPEDERELDFELELALRLLDIGRIAAGIRVADAAVAAAAGRGDRVGELRARLIRTRLQARWQPKGATAQIRAVAAEALPLFEAAGDYAALHDAWAAIYWVEQGLAHYQAMAKAAERSLEYARLAGDPGRELGSLGSRLGAHFWGPTPTDEVLRLLEDEDHGLERGHMWPRAALAMVSAMLGRFDAARAQIAEAQAIAGDRGRIYGLATTYEASWVVETLAGDADAAERSARRGYELLELIEARSGSSTLAGCLALALADLGRADEALHWVAVCEETTATDDVINLILVPRARARVLAGRGELDEAERLGREAVAVAARTDMLNEHGDALTDLAEVLLLAGKRGDAAEALERALALYWRKGNLVRAEQTRAKLAELRHALATRPGELKLEFS